MHPSPRARRTRRVAAAALVAASLPLLSGCASNFDSPVLQNYNATEGVNVREDGVWGMNMIVVLSEDGQGTLVATLLNTTRTPDRLVGATVQLGKEDKGQLTASMVRPSVTLPPDKLVQLNKPQTVQVQGRVESGLFTHLTLQFQRSQPIDVEVPVLRPEGPYGDLLLPESSASPTPSPTEPTQSGQPGQGGQGAQGQRQNASPSPSPEGRG